MHSILKAMPGRQARVVYHTGKQWQRVGQLLDMADPDRVWATALAYQRQHPERAMRLDVLASPNWQVPPLQSIQLQSHASQPALAGPSPAPMSPAAQTPTIVLPPAAPYQEPPAGMGTMERFMYQHQEMRLAEARQHNTDLTNRLNASEQEKRELKEKLDTATMELRHKDREHQADLRDMRNELRQELEEDSKPAGLNGFMTAIADPAHPLAALAGLVATKMLGAGGPPAEAAPAMGGPARTKNMQDILNGLAELITSEEMGTKLYAALARILPHPDGLTQLLVMAGLSEPQNAL